MTTAPADAAIERFSVQIEIAINAPRSAVWDALVNDTAAWWPADFVFTPGSTITIEPHAGGRVVETNGQGFELLWGSILAIDPGKAMNWQAPFSPPYAGPGMSFIHITLDDADGDSTTFTLTQHYIGAPNENHKAQLTEGWKMLFEGGLKAHVEK